MTKVCPSCNEDKSLEDYPIDRNRPSGKYPYCKPCANLKGKEYRLANPEKRKETSARCDKNYRARFPEKIKAYNQKHYEENPEIWQAAGRRRRARMLKVEHEHYTKEQILELYGANCHICGEEVDLKATGKLGQEGWEKSLHLDHVIPISKGGPDMISNIRPSHAKCNIVKRDKLVGMINEPIVEETAVAI